jgi:hypothetical protein
MVGIAHSPARIWANLDERRERTAIRELSPRVAVLRIISPTLGGSIDLDEASSAYQAHYSKVAAGRDRSSQLQGESQRLLSSP